LAFDVLLKQPYTSRTLPSIDLRRRRTDVASAKSNHSCQACGGSLVLVRRHVSPPRLGPPLTTEYFRCEACDSGYQHSPATGRWKRHTYEDD
jgi:hypothetical protein